MNRAERLLAKCDHDDPNACWTWTGPRTFEEIPLYSYTVPGTRRSTTMTARRAMFLEFVGPIPDGLRIVTHATCARLCVNPAHLRLATRQQIVKRGIATRKARYPRATHCGRGHEYNEENTYVGADGHRSCRVCARERRLERIYG